MANKTWIYNAYLAQNALDIFDSQKENNTEEESGAELKKQEVPKEEVNNKPQLHKPRIAGVFQQNYGGMRI